MNSFNGGGGGLWVMPPLAPPSIRAWNRSIKVFGSVLLFAYCLPLVFRMSPILQYVSFIIDPECCTCSTTGFSVFTAIEITTRSTPFYLSIPLSPPCNRGKATYSCHKNFFTAEFYDERVD